MRRIPVVLALFVGVLFPLGAADTATAAPCTNPKFVTSDENGMWSDGDYVVHNNMWNASGYDVAQTTSVCSYRNWYTTVSADDSTGDRATKTYPNVHKDYHNWQTGAEPLVSSFTSITSTFAAPGCGGAAGIYNVAYDLWLNGVPGNREVMIWTENHGQFPAGSFVEGGFARCRARRGSSTPPSTNSHSDLPAGQRRQADERHPRSFQGLS